SMEGDDGIQDQVGLSEAEAGGSRGVRGAEPPVFSPDEVPYPEGLPGGRSERCTAARSGGSAAERGLASSAPGRSPTRSGGARRRRRGGAKGPPRRRLPFELTVLDEEGGPWAGRRVTGTERPWGGAFTDASGHVVLPPYRYGRDAVWTVHDQDGEVALNPILIPQRRPMTLRPAEAPLDLAERGEPCTRLAIRIEGIDPDLEPHRRPEVQITTPAGFATWGSPGEHVVPRGLVLVQLGQAFHGWREELFDLEFTTETAELVLRPIPEPRLRVFLPAEWYRLHVQAGDDSITAEERMGEAGAPFVCSIPAGEPVTVIAESATGGLRRARLDPIEADTDLRLDGDDCVLRAGFDVQAHPRVALAVELADENGEAVLEDDLDVWSAAGEGAAQRTGPGSWRMEVPAGLPLELDLRAEGFTTVHRRFAAPTVVEPAPRRVTLERRAALVLRGNLAAVEVGGARPAVENDAVALDVAPGPLLLSVHRWNAPPLALELLLVPGERRMLTVR
ncbi:MAG: hypothetical protein AB1726_01795, partial [Planctomycetota bacterium]